jgi:hypothetical protein
MSPPGAKLRGPRRLRNVSSDRARLSEIVPHGSVVEGQDCARHSVVRHRVTRRAPLGSRPRPAPLTAFVAARLHRGSNYP